MDCNDKRVIEKLYWQQTGAVRFGDELFLIRIAFYHQNVSTCIQKRFSMKARNYLVGRENINNLRYANDRALLAESESDLQSI
jgi:hypothetical protein